MGPNWNASIWVQSTLNFEKDRLQKFVLPRIKMGSLFTLKYDCIEMGPLSNSQRYILRGAPLDFQVGVWKFFLKKKKKP